MTAAKNENSDLTQDDSESVLNHFSDDYKKEMLQRARERSQEQLRSRNGQDSKPNQEINGNADAGNDNVRKTFEKPQNQSNVSDPGAPKKPEPKRGIGSTESLGASLMEGLKWIWDLVKKVLRLFFKSISDGTKDSLSGKEKGPAILPRKGVRTEDLSGLPDNGQVAPAALGFSGLTDDEIKSRVLALTNDDSVIKDVEMTIEENEGGNAPSERVAQVMAIVRDAAYEILKDSHGDLSLSTHKLAKGLSEYQAIVTQKALERFGEDALNAHDLASVVVALPDVIVDDLFSGDAARELKAFLFNDDMMPLMAELGKRKEMIRIAQSQTQEGIVDASLKPAEDVDKEIEMLGARANMPEIQPDELQSESHRMTRPRGA